MESFGLEQGFLMIPRPDLIQKIERIASRADRVSGAYFTRLPAPSFGCFCRSNLPWLASWIIMKSAAKFGGMSGYFERRWDAALTKKGINDVRSNRGFGWDGYVGSSSRALPRHSG